MAQIIPNELDQLGVHPLLKSVIDHLLRCRIIKTAFASQTILKWVARGNALPLTPQQTARNIISNIIIRILGISAASIYRILTENLGYIKAGAKFVPHNLKPHEKDLRIQHSRDIIKEPKKNRNFLYSIVTGDET